MPNRIIRDSCRTSATLFRLSADAERFFWRLLTVADDFGRFEANPQILKSLCFPLWEDKIMPVRKVSLLYGELEADLVTSYVVDGKRFGFFRTWERYQNRRKKWSKYPDPSPASICEQLPANVAQKREARSEKREARVGDDAASPQTHANGFHASKEIRAALDLAPILGLVPRLRTDEFWCAEVRANPELDMPRQIARSEAWLTANQRRSPKKDLSRFLHNWLARAEPEGD